MIDDITSIITTQYHLLNIEQNLNNLFIGIPSYSIVFEGRESPLFLLHKILFENMVRGVVQGGRATDPSTQPSH